MSQFVNQVNSDRRIIGIPVIGNPSALTPNLQFNSVQNAFVWVAASSSSVSDLEFLQTKELAGELLRATGYQAGPAPLTVCSITPANGKRFYLYDVAYLLSNSSGAKAHDESELQFDGVNKETMRCVLNDGLAVSQKTAVRGTSLLGDGAKIIRVQQVTGAANLYIGASIEGWIV